MNLTKNITVYLSLMFVLVVYSMSATTQFFPMFRAAPWAMVYSCKLCQGPPTLCSVPHYCHCASVFTWLNTSSEESQLPS